MRIPTTNDYYVTTTRRKTEDDCLFVLDFRLTERIVSRSVNVIGFGR